MKTRAHKALLTVFAAALAAACALIVPDPGPPVPGRAGIFPHLPHAGEDGGMDCVDCHAGAETEVLAGMPDLETCYDCHDSETDPETPLSAQPAGFVLEEGGGATWSSVTALRIKTQFSHAVHAAAGTSCESCHEGVADSEQVDRSWRVGMADCLSCHENADIDVGGCVGCHEGLDQSTSPEGHNNLWLQTHGALGRDQMSWGLSPAQDCSLCHQESSCNDCHLRTEPLDHTEPWRLRGHGFSAALDRDRCDVCHTENSCVRCHRSTTPVTHSGIWGGGTSAHCASCHIPLGFDSGCATCHRGTPSHRRATSIPGGSHPGSGSDCRSCHIPLDHFDNGQACTLCHR